MFSKGDILTVDGKQYTVIDHKNVEFGKFKMILLPGIWEEEKPGVWIKRMIFKRGVIKEYLEINPDIGSGFSREGNKIVWNKRVEGEQTE